MFPIITHKKYTMVRDGESLRFAFRLSLGVAFCHQLVVSENAFIRKCYGVSACSNHSLHQIFLQLPGPYKYNIARLRVRRNWFE